MMADLRTGLFLMCCVSSFVYVHVGRFTYWFISHVLCFLICLCACWLIYVLVYFSCVVFPHLFMCMLADLRTGLFLMRCVSSFVYVRVG